MDLKEFCEVWKFAVYHLSGYTMSLYLEKGDSEVSLLRDGARLKTWDGIPETVTIGEVTIWPNLPEVTAWSIREEHLKILNEHNPYPGQTWIKQGESTAVPVLRRV